MRTDRKRAGDGSTGGRTAATGGPGRKAGTRAIGRWILPLSVGLLVLGGYLSACQTPGPSEVLPTPTKTPRPPVALATSTNTPAPTETQGAHSSRTPLPSAAQTATPAVTSTATPEPTATDIPPVAEGLCPLTGLPVSAPALLERRPLAIKVNNAALARPQYGLLQADIVYEHMSEAAITRYTAIYLCQNAGRVGSIRSGRFIDFEIPAMYKSLFAFSGSCPGLLPKFDNADFVDRQYRSFPTRNASVFYRDLELIDKGVPFEHTLFVNAVDVWANAAGRGLGGSQDLRGLTFDEQVPAAGEPAAHLRLPFPSRDMVVDWRYDAGLGRYLRWVEGKPAVDAETGEQISATNVIVIYATHVDSQTIFEDPPRNNHPSVQIQLWGNGPAVIFRDGQALRGLWARPQREDMVVLRDPAGQVPLPLKPGNSWFELVPLPGHRWSFEAEWDAGP